MIFFERRAIVQEIAQEPILNTTARTHPLAAEGAKWKGVPLSEPYQTALDNNPERGLNIGTDKDNTSAVTAGYKESASDEVKDGAYAMKDKVLGVTTGHPSASTRPAGPDANIDSTTADTGHSPVTHKRDGSTASNASHPVSTSSGGSKTKSTVSGNSGGSGKGSGNEGSPHRSSFMDKIKGEVKVISGKLAHDEAKVEEGRRLMGKAV